MVTSADHSDAGSRCLALILGHHHGIERGRATAGTDVSADGRPSTYLPMRRLDGAHVPGPRPQIDGQGGPHDDDDPSDRVRDGGGGTQAVSYLSRQTTLEPGDVISTGTPAGVGHRQGLFLRSGTEVRIEIEGIGALVNICA